MPRKFRSDAFLFWSRGPDGYRKNDRKRAVVWPWLVLELCTVLALTQLGIRQSDWWRAEIRSTNLHIVIEYITNTYLHHSASLSQFITLLEILPWLWNNHQLLLTINYHCKFFHCRLWLPQKGEALFFYFISLDFYLSRMYLSNLINST